MQITEQSRERVKERRILQFLFVFTLIFSPIDLMTFGVRAQNAEQVLSGADYFKQLISCKSHKDTQRIIINIPASYFNNVYENKVSNQNNKDVTHNVFNLVEKLNQLSAKYMPPLNCKQAFEWHEQHHSYKLTRYFFEQIVIRLKYILNNIIEQEGGEMPALLIEDTANITTLTNLAIAKWIQNIMFIANLNIGRECTKLTSTDKGTRHNGAVNLMEILKYQKIEGLMPPN
jgi:hypothetical protein